MWWIYAVLSAIFAALPAVFAKEGMKGINADMATAVRTTLVLIVVWMITAWKSPDLSVNSLSTKNWIFLILSAIATGLSWIFYYRALQIGKVSQVAPIDKTSLALTILLSVLFLGEALTWKVALGTVMIIVGAIIIAL